MFGYLRSQIIPTAHENIEHESDGQSSQWQEQEKFGIEEHDGNQDVQHHGRCVGRDMKKASHLQRLLEIGDAHKINDSETKASSKFLWLELREDVVLLVERRRKIGARIERARFFIDDGQLSGLLFMGAEKGLPMEGRDVFRGVGLLRDGHPFFDLEHELGKTKSGV